MSELCPAYHREPMEIVGAQGVIVDRLGKSVTVVHDDEVTDACIRAGIEETGHDVAA